VPILVGYIAYFVLNRLGTVILQRHVAVDQVAIFGVAQQLSMIVAIACTSFGMALQPAVFAAEPTQAMGTIRRASRILTLLVFSVTCALILFGAELFALIAPKSYGGGQQILLLLLVGNFTNAFTLMSDTTLLYHRRPKTSVAVSILSAIAATCLGLWLVPQYQLNGAALAVTGGLVIRMLLSHWMAYRVAGTAFLTPMVVAITTLCLLASIADWLRVQELQLTAAVGAKALLGACILLSIYLIYRKSQPQPCAR
jgi:O-antigen/teichoic acid export membrane protein